MSILHVFYSEQCYSGHRAGALEPTPSPGAGSGATEPNIIDCGYVKHLLFI